MAHRSPSSASSRARLVGFAIATCLATALTAGGCITSGSSPTNEIDAAIPLLDASEDVTSVADAADANLPDAGDAGDAAPKAAPGITQVGLVAGGTVSRSPSYGMIGSTGPSTAPVLRSTHYQFVGALAVSSKP